MGSTFKALTIAMALEANKVNLNTRIDVRGPLAAGRSFIHDYHPEGHPLTVPEVFKFSSNIGTARMALMVGVEGHKAFLRKMGQMDRMRTELPENAEPIVPRNWSLVSTMTIAFGHGLAVAPLQAMMAVAALVNGGYLIVPTFLKRPDDFDKTSAPRVVRPETSESLRYIMRLNAEDRHGEERPIFPAISSAARPARRKRSSTAITTSTSCSPPSWRSCPPTSRAICS